MATRNQVLSLFGASPEQIMQRQAQEQARALQAIQNPYQQVGAVIGTGLGRLFGGEDPEVAKQRELYAMLEGVNLESPEQLRAAAASLASQFPDRALQLISMADQMETTAQQRSTSAAQAAAAQAQADFTKVPVITMKQTIDPLTNQVIQTPTITEITVPVGEAEQYRDRFNKAMESSTTASTTPAPATDPRGKFVARTYVNGQPIDIYEDAEGNRSQFTADGQPVTATQQSSVDPNYAGSVLPEVQRQANRPLFPTNPQQRTIPQQQGATDQLNPFDFGG